MKPINKKDVKFLKNYCIAPRSVLRSKELSSTAKILYLELLDRSLLSAENNFVDAEGNTYIYYSNSDLAKNLEISKATVSKKKQELKAAGLLLVEKIDDMYTNKMTVLIPEESIMTEQERIDYKKSKKSKKHHKVKQEQPKEEYSNKPLPQEQEKEAPAQPESPADDYKQSELYEDTSSTASRDDTADNPNYSEIVDYLNEKAKTKYRPNNKKTKSLINARFNEGFTLDDFKKVIDIKVSDWFDDSLMHKYLRPETLFGTKFESYLNQNQVPQSYLNYIPDDLPF